MTTYQIVALAALAMYFVQAIGTTIRWTKFAPSATAVNFVAAIFLFGQLGALIAALVLSGFFGRLP